MYIIYNISIVHYWLLLYPSAASEVLVKKNKTSDSVYTLYVIICERIGNNNK